MKAVLNGLFVAGAIVLGAISATVAFYSVLSDGPVGWPVRLGLLIVYFWMSHSTMMLAYGAGVGVREQDERAKASRDAANRLGEALG